MLNSQLEGVNVPFCTLVMKVAGETTYSQMTRTCERRRLETFIKEYLVQNPISAAAKKSKKLSEWYNRKGGHALSNRMVAPINQREERGLETNFGIHLILD